MSRDCIFATFHFANGCDREYDGELVRPSDVDTLKAALKQASRFEGRRDGLPSRFCLILDGRQMNVVGSDPPNCLPHDPATVATKAITSFLLTENDVDRLATERDAAVRRSRSKEAHERNCVAKVFSLDSHVCSDAGSVSGEVRSLYVPWGNLLFMFSMSIPQRASPSRKRSITPKTETVPQPAGVEPNSIPRDTPVTDVPSTFAPPQPHTSSQDPPPAQQKPANEWENTNSAASADAYANHPHANNYYYNRHNGYYPPYHAHGAWPAYPTVAHPHHHQPYWGGYGGYPQHDSYYGGYPGYGRGGAYGEYPPTPAAPESARAASSQPAGQVSITSKSEAVPTRANVPAEPEGRPINKHVRVAGSASPSARVGADSSRASSSSEWDREDDDPHHPARKSGSRRRKVRGLAVEQSSGVVGVVADSVQPATPVPAPTAPLVHKGLPSSITLPPALKAQLDAVKRCDDCKTTKSPEWRRGPGGPKTLCNACGLRYARNLSKLNTVDAGPTGGLGTVDA